MEIEAQLNSFDYDGPPVPSTLMINQESRKETLRHYLLYYQDDELLQKVPTEASSLRSTRNVHNGPRPICYSPGRDLLFLYYWPEHISATNALLRLVAEKCEPIGEIRVLATSCFSYFPKWSGGVPDSNPLGFTIFHDLKEICCVIEPGLNEPGEEWHKSDVTEAVGKAFDLQREKCQSHNKPKISFFDSLPDFKRNMRSLDW